MRTFGTFLLAATLGAGLVFHGAPAEAKKKKGHEEGGASSGEEFNKLKAVSLGDPKLGSFKWGMKPEEVMAQVRISLDKKYEPRIKQAAQDPGKQQRIRDEKEREIQAVKKSYTKFEGSKSGWDVSIIGPEFQQQTGEAVLVTKEDIWTRYFFFFEDGLYKMFLAFNKDRIEGKTFQDFGKGMEEKYGRAKEVYRDEKTKAGMRHVLDHFEWSAGGDRLKLVDRSEFYGVYCLVLAEGDIQKRLTERRKVVNPGATQRDSLVEAVTAKENDNGRDSNDNVIDRLTGKDIKRPGDEDKHGDIVVPSPSRSGSPASGGSDQKAAASAPEKESPSSKKKGKKDNALEGLEL